MLSTLLFDSAFGVIELLMLTLKSQEIHVTFQHTANYFQLFFTFPISPHVLPIKQELLVMTDLILKREMWRY